MCKLTEKGEKALVIAQHTVLFFMLGVLISTCGLTESNTLNVYSCILSVALLLVGIFLSMKLGIIDMSEDQEEG